MAVAFVVFKADRSAEGAAAFLAAVAMLGSLVLFQRLIVWKCMTTARRHSEHNRQLILQMMAVVGQDEEQKR